MTIDKAIEILEDFAVTIHPFSSSDLDRALELAIKTLREVSND